MKLEEVKKEILGQVFSALGPHSDYYKLSVDYQESTIDLRGLSFADTAGEKFLVYNEKQGIKELHDRLNKIRNYLDVTHPQHGFD